MPDPHRNFAYSTVAAAPSPADTGVSLSVQAGDGARFASPANAIVCPAGQQPLPGNAEIVRVSAIAGDVLTIVRQQEGSAARLVQVGDQIFGGATNKTMTDVEQVLGAPLQNGVMLAGDCALSGVAVAGGSGQITFTLAAASPIWIVNAAGLLVPVAYAGAANALTPGVLPAAGKYRGYGIEMDVTGALTLNSGTDQTTAALALANINTVAAAGKLRVADVIVLNTAGVYSNAGTRDRRPWARGGYSRLVRNANAGGGNDYTTASTSFVVIDATNLTIRLECSGAPLRLRLAGRHEGSVSGYDTLLGFFVDAAAVDSNTGGVYAMASPGAFIDEPLNVVWDTIPAAGSHLLQPVFAVSNVALTAYILARSGYPMQFTVEELVRQNANNGTS